MKVSETRLPGVMLVEPSVHGDERGFFFESYHARRFAEAGLSDTFVQDNHSRSRRGTLRGLHLQHPHPQAKLVRVISGSVFDVAVDVRLGSPHFGQWVGVELTEENFRQLYVPEGFAHGFAVTSEIADFEYKCSGFYEPSAEVIVSWNDPAIGIDWPIEEPLLSERDARAMPLAEMESALPRYST